MIRLNLNRLKAERIAKGYSQDYMAKKLGWATRAPYAKRELGLVNIGVDEFMNIINILGYSNNEIGIFFEDVVPESEQINKSS